MAAAIPAQLYHFDSHYLSALQGGDTETEGHLFRYFTPFVLRKVSKYLQSPELVQEATQETFSRVLIAAQSNHGVRHPERFGAFVHAVCRNVALEIWRRESRFVSLEEANSSPLESCRSPHCAAEAAETAALVRRILASLPPMDRQLLEAVFLEEQDRQDVCRRFGVSSAYLRVLLHRAKRRFTVGVLAQKRRSEKSVAKSHRQSTAVA
jgi:RNA polymerase sigma-70 factor (ECF subfamily)